VKATRPVSLELRQTCRSSSQREGTGAEGGLYLGGGRPGNILMPTPETYVRGVVRLW